MNKSKFIFLFSLVFLTALMVSVAAFADDNSQVLFTLLNNQITENEALTARVKELEEQLALCQASCVKQIAVSNEQIVRPVTQNTSDTCTNQAEFIDDITIKDWSEVGIGENFTKVWRLRNTGTCTWTPNYRVAQVGGFKMGGSSYAYLNNTVRPGDMVDVAIDLKAPTYIGGYQTEFRLQDDRGNQFGIIGTKTKQEMSFWLKVNVIDKSVCSLLSFTPSVAGKGEDIDAKFVIKNNSGRTWGSGDYDVRMTSGKDMLKFDKSYIDLPKSVGAGDKLELVYDMITPSQGGNYPVYIQLVSGGSVYCEVYGLLAVR